MFMLVTSNTDLHSFANTIFELLYWVSALMSVHISQKIYTSEVGGV